MGNPGNASSSSSSCRGRRGPAGFGLALARLVRRMRRRSKMLLCTAAPTGASSRCRQYDPLSYARNFDRDGFGSALDDDVSGAGNLCHHYTFASRFVLPSSSYGRQQQ
ncbi:hypothetical protein CFC21_111125 [Triticum aestivum]|uniref:Uncharacterized protein n=3 Tax=Triticinae TaxID=1648030 RepID=A0A453SZP4_AEGTS|nr:uncharacterized protein LOC109753659 [Aegilops tauschii subsp. strangulata]XP_044443371.1 uncharacterized protein LOC123169571 [Triticum aestivum]KAF7111075.1 hypothetical protein CFC21_111125 [Triticum aestivum]